MSGERQETFQEYFREDFLHAVVSGARRGEETAKIRIRPVKKREELFFSARSFGGSRSSTAI